MCEFSTRQHPHAFSEPAVEVCGIAPVQHNLPKPFPYEGK